jgi:hypothetical protein
MASSPDHKMTSVFQLAKSPLNSSSQKALCIPS